MRTLARIMAVILSVSLCAGSPSQATTENQFPSASYIQFGKPLLAPMAFVRFCMAYQGDCRPKRHFAWHHAYKASRAQFAELTVVNSKVNRSIRYRYAYRNAIAERWNVSPAWGACADYAVTKRHELLQRGWPARALLLAEVIVADGEHHLVLVVHTTRGDFVLDSLTAAIVRFDHAYRSWVRIQSPLDPQDWASIDVPLD